MSRAIVCLWSFVILVSAAVLASSAARAATARAQARLTQRDLQATSDDAAELARLRQARTEVPERSAGEGGLATKVSAAMARAGLAASILQSLSPEAQAAAIGEAGSRLSRQRATLTLSGVSLPQVGRFLDAWRTAEPDWIVAGIDLTPVNSKEAPSIGTDLPLRAVLIIEGVFKETRSGAAR